MKKVLFLILVVSGVKAMYRSSMTPWQLKQLYDNLEIQKQQLLAGMLAVQQEMIQVMERHRRQQSNQIAGLSRKLSGVENRLKQELQRNCAAIEGIKNILSKPVKMVIEMPDEEQGKKKEQEREIPPPPPSMYL